MLDVRADSIIYQSKIAYAAMVDKLVTSKRIGKAKDPIWRKCLAIRRYLKALEYVDRLEDQTDATYILECLIQLTDINNFPAAPVLGTTTVPNILVGKAGGPGDKGDKGDKGDAGLATDFTLSPVITTSPVDVFPIADSPGARWDYVVTEASGAQRAGTVMASWASSGSSIELTDFAHADLSGFGDTTGIEFDVIYSAPNIILEAVVTSGSWFIRGSRYYIPNNGSGSGPISDVLLNNHIFVGNASNTAIGVLLTGAITTTNTGATILSANVVSNVNVVAGAGILLTKLAAQTINRAAIFDGSGFLSPSTVTSTELGYLSGATSNLQAQITAGLIPALTASRPVITNGSSGLVSNPALSTNRILKWNGTQFADSIIVDNGTQASIGANVVMVSSVGLLSKTIDIGDWNMSSTASKNVAHGISYKKIRSVTVIVRDDTDITYVPLTRGNASFTPQGAVDQITTTNVVLLRVLGGSFDNTSYDSTGYNRGWVTIEYIP